jgi:F5/8 type C domain
MALQTNSSTTKTPRPGLRARAARLAGLAAAGALAAGIALPAAASAASASTGISYGTLDTQTSTAATEAKSGVSMAMFELNWASFEPANGTLSQSYLATMKSELAAYQAAGQKVTLGLGLQNPPSWVMALPNSRYVDQNGNQSSEANFVFSQNVRTAAAAFLALVNKALPFSQFWAIRLTSGGDGEMLYPGGGTYWAFDQAALTGNGLAAGMTKNPYPNWKPGTAGLTQTQIDSWVNWYIGGLDNVTNWQMTTLNSLGFTGYYETVTPGSGTRPDYLASEEQNNLNDQSTTGVGAVWDRYYAALAGNPRVIAYISSVADQSGGNDSCQAADASTALTATTMDSFSATRWISAIARHDGLALGGENPGYGLPASLDSFYVNTTSTGMMAAALRQAASCGFTVFYWAHDIHLWDGTIPFSLYASSINPGGTGSTTTTTANLAQAGTMSASSALSGFPASNASDGNQNSYWQATGSSASVTLHLAQAAPVGRIVLELPQNWGTRSQTIQVDISTNGKTWTTLAPAQAYQFTAGSNTVTLSGAPTTTSYLRLDISGNNVQGVPQIAEFQAYSS